MAKRALVKSTWINDTKAGYSNLAISEFAFLYVVAHIFSGIR
jgi:hypothetical protein